MTNKVLTCVGCPAGCRINVEMEGDEIRTITGNKIGRAHV